MKRELPCSKPMMLTWVVPFPRSFNRRTTLYNWHRTRYTEIVPITDVLSLPILSFPFSHSFPLGSSGSADSSSASSLPANYAYDNNNCRMTILVGHIFRNEGTFLPSAIIESQIHRIHVTLDKRINVFQLLEGPIINVTKVLSQRETDTR